MMYVEMSASDHECRAAAFCDLICKRVQASRPTRNDLDILRSVLEGDGLREHELIGHLNNLERALRKRRWTNLHQEVALLIRARRQISATGYRPLPASG